MTEAICMFCGKRKWGGFTACESCGKEPVSEDDYVLSLLLTDHYLDQQTLEVIGQDIVKGKRPNIDPASKAKLLEVVRQLPNFAGSEKKKRSEFSWFGRKK